MHFDNFDKDKVVHILNDILKSELAGVVRYTHYSLMIYGWNRLPIIDWLKAQASESLMHAQQAGEMITDLGGHPALDIGPLLETHQHDIDDILRESLDHEKTALKLYYDLLAEVKDRSVLLEEYSRGLIQEEEKHISEVDKMLRSPGDVHRYQDEAAAG